jgi:VWFA-related protein
MLASALPLAAGAQITVSAWPQVRVEMFAVDRKGEPLPGLAPGDLAVKENGHPVKIADVSRSTKPMSICLLVDAYQSDNENAPIRKERWDNMREAVDRFVDSLPADDEVCLAAFTTPRKIAQVFTLSHQKIMDAFDLVDGEHMGLPSALYGTSMYMRRMAHREDRAIVMISFLPEASLKDPRLWESLEQAEIPPLHVIQVPRLHVLGTPGRQSDHEDEEKTNRQIAKMGGGLSYFPWDKKELDASVDHLSSALKNRYALTYESENQKRDGLLRRVDVELDKVHQKERDVVSAPEGYYAPSR